VTKKKYYFAEDEPEVCYTLEDHRESMEINDLEELKLFEAKTQKVDGFMWCRAIDDVGETGECGKQCEHYEPKNGKSGMCRNQGKLYEATNKVKTLKRRK
jgi:hypothetical protein